MDGDDVQVRTRAKSGSAVAEVDGWVVALDTTVTPALDLEGRARDLVRRIQQLRKDRDLPVTARIEVTRGPRQTSRIKVTRGPRQTSRADGTFVTTDATDRGSHG